MTHADTHHRIVRATRELHEEVGPAATTISGIAERAGVQRLTVYRHFPDTCALLSACSSDWARDHPFPSATEWSGIPDPRARLARALSALYDYYRRGAPMLERVLGDEARVPELADIMTPWWDSLREIAGALSAGWGTGGETQHRLRAVVGHAIRFESWRSLTDDGLTDEDVVRVMVAWIEALADRARP